MAVPSVSDLTTLLGDADPASVRAFVTGLYDARGHTVTPTDTGFTVDGPDTGPVVVHTGADDPTTFPLSDAAEVVTVDPSALPETAAPVVDVADLHRQLLYAIDRPQAATLLADTLGRDVFSFEDNSSKQSVASTDSLSAATGPAGTTGTTGTRQSTTREGRDETTEVATRQSSTAGGATTTVDGRVGPVPDANEGLSETDGKREEAGRQHRMALFGAVALLGLAALAGPGFVGWTGDSSAAIGALDSNGSVAGGNGSGGDELGSQAITVNGSGLPPGVDTTGAIDEQRLGDATEDALRNRSYRVTISYREFRGDKETAVYSETVRVANESHYSASATRLGEFERGPTVIAGRDLYATPSGTTERTDASGRAQVAFRNGTAPASDLVADDLERYVRWYLSVEESVVTAERADSETSVYRLLTEGDPYTGVTNASGSAVVDSDGVVRHLRRTYDEPADRNLQVVVTIRVSDVGSTTVTRPAWA